MKKILVAYLLLGASTLYNKVNAQQDTALAGRAAEWVKALQLGDAGKERRVEAVIYTHLSAVKDWHNAHPGSAVPSGINPATGKPLSEMDKDIIANSAMPRSVHDSLMNGLKRDLTDEQVIAILDKYTIGKVAFTMKAYREIVPNITPVEDSTIYSYLMQAREQAVDFKNMKEISAIFEIYKTKAEQFLNSNGRNWRTMYSDYTKMLKAKKAAEAPSKKP